MAHKERRGNQLNKFLKQIIKECIHEEKTMLADRTPITEHKGLEFIGEWDNCYKACMDIGHAIGYDDIAIAKDSKIYGNNYSLLRKYLVLLKEKSTVPDKKNKPKINRSSSLFLNFSKLSDASDLSLDESLSKEEEVKNKKLIDLVRNDQYYSFLKEDLQQQFNYGIREHISGIEAIDVSDPHFCNLAHSLNERYKDQNYSSQLKDLEKTIFEMALEKNSFEHEKNIETIIFSIIRMVKHLKSFANEARYKANSKGLTQADQEKFKMMEVNFNKYILAYKAILNDVMELVATSNEGKFKSSLKENVCDHIERAFMDYLSSKMRVIFGGSYQKSTDDYAQFVKIIMDELSPIQSINDRTTSKEIIFSNDTQDAPLSNAFAYLKNSNSEFNITIIDYIDLLNRSITIIEQCKLPENVDRKKAQCFIEFLKENKQLLLREWSIHLNPEKSDEGEFGYSNPHFLFGLGEKIQQEISTACAIGRQELKNEFSAYLKNSINKIKENEKTLKKITFKERFKRLSGPQDNQKYSSTHIETVISKITKELKGIDKKITGREDTSVELYLNEALQAYGEQICGKQGLDATSEEAVFFLTKQKSKIGTFVKDNKNMLALLSQPSDQLLSPKPSNELGLIESLYNRMVIVTHQKIYNKTSNKNIWMMVVDGVTGIFGRPNFDDQINQLLIKLNFSQSKDILYWTTEHYVQYFEEIRKLIQTLRNAKFIYLRYQANILEKFCHDLVDFHILKSSQLTLNLKDDLALSFSKVQLSRIKQVLFDIQDKDNNKSKNMINQLEEKILRLEQRPEKRIYLEETSNSTGINEYRTEQGCIDNSAKNFDIFFNTFIERMQSVTIANSAISSGKIPSNTSEKGALANLGVAAISHAVPLANAASPLITVIDQKNNQDVSTGINEKIGLLYEWLPLVKELAKRLLDLFKPQIAKMVDIKDVRKFAEFCQVRMFSALASRPAWEAELDLNMEGENENDKLKSEKMIRFLIAAVFKQQDKLNFIPFAVEDHYHTIGDTSLLGNLTFQRMVNYSGFLITKENNDTSVYMNKNSLVQSKTIPVELKRKRLQNYGFLDGSHDPEFFDKLASTLDRKKYVLPSSASRNDSLIEPQDKKGKAFSLFLRQHTGKKTYENKEKETVLDFVTTKATELKQNRR